MIVPLPRDDNGVPLQGTYRNMTSGVKNVTTAGTPVQLLSTSTECKRIDIVAKVANGGTIFIGGSNTLASTSTGIPILATGSYTFFVTDVSTVWIDSTVNGEGVSFVYFS